MKRRKTNGFSVLEVISALVILAVVTAAAAATIAPMRTVDQQQAAQEIAMLNELAAGFMAKEGHFPKNLQDLVRTGYLPESDFNAGERIRRIRRNYRYSNATGTFSPR